MDEGPGPDAFRAMARESEGAASEGQMMLDAEILPIFLEEAAGYVRTLRDPASGIEDQRRAAHGLKGASSLLELGRLQASAKQLMCCILDGDHAAMEQELARTEQLLQTLRKHGTEQAMDEAGPADEAAKAHRTEDQPGVPTKGLGSGSREGDEPWGEAEADLLRGIFVEEAEQHLEAMSAALFHLEGEPGSGRGPVEDLLRSVHTLKGSAATVGRMDIGKAAHRLEDELAGLRQATALPSRTAVDKIFQIVDIFRSMIMAPGETDRQAERLDAVLGQLRDCMQGEPGGGAAHEVARPMVPDDELDVGSPPSEGDEAHDRRRGDRRAWPGRRWDEPTTIRVAPERLDQMMNQLGELLIDRTRIERRLEELHLLSHRLGYLRELISTTQADPRGPLHPAVQHRQGELAVDLLDCDVNLKRAIGALHGDCEALRRTNQAMQEQLSRIYLTPIGWLHQRLQRPLREMAKRQGKQLRLVIHDEASEMDRAVVDQIIDPLIQLLRNAVVHGIEPSDERRAMGKDPVGRIELRMSHRGDVVYLEVQDDGAGIDTEALRQVLRERGGPQGLDPALLDDARVRQLIFESGFSTRSEADQFAGRGVGLDVVRKNIERLGGEIRVESTPGQGTRFLIQVPMTTAIAQALLFKVGDQVYAVPASHVEQGLLLPASEVQRRGEALRLRRQGRWIPVLDLPRLLGLARAEPTESFEEPLPGQAVPLLLLRQGELRFAMICSRLIGVREIVLKHLGTLLAPHPLLAAATVSGSNKVQFVLDVGTLARAAVKGELGPPAYPSRDLTPTPETLPLPDGPGKSRILLCDDSRVVRETLGHWLRAAGYLVDLATDGREAWEKLQLRPYHLLLTDLEMPRLHGLELITRCAQYGLIATMPIVVITSRGSPETRLKARAEGAAAFMEKPLNRQKMLSEIEDLLRPTSATIEENVPS